MADQHLNLCPVTSGALHFADGFEEIGVDIVVLNHTPGLGGWFVKSHISGDRGVGGTVFNVESLQLALIDRNTTNSV